VKDEVRLRSTAVSSLGVDSPVFSVYNDDGPRGHFHAVPIKLEWSFTEEPSCETLVREEGS
jgi:hypothetical protein